jgi:hypothetical protein
MSKKILVLGVGQNNFLSYLYGTLKRFNDQFVITAPFYSDLNATHKDESWMYNNEHIQIKPSLFAVFKSILLSSVTSHFYHTFFFILGVEGKFKKAIHFAYKHIQAQAFFIQNNHFAECDIFHFHFMQYSYLRELFLVPKDKKIVCSFWGSDLLRTSDILNFHIVKKALNRATTITCQSAELREIILSKFGRNLFDKIQITMFPVDAITYNHMDVLQNNEEKMAAFKTKFGFATDKLNVLIGHNGSPFNNHLEIIDQIQKSVHARQLHLIINLNYGISATEKESYKNKLINTLKASECSYTIIEHFFSKEELALSRLSTDVFIHLPISDALSGSMLEMLYAGCIVMTGSWLPYKTFLNAKLTYHEVIDFSRITEKIDFIITNFEAEKETSKHNAEAIKNHFLTDAIVKKWNTILS